MTLCQDYDWWTSITSEVSNSRVRSCSEGRDVYGQRLNRLCENSKLFKAPKSSRKGPLLLLFSVRFKKQYITRCKRVNQTITRC